MLASHHSPVSVWSHGICVYVIKLMSTPNEYFILWNIKKRSFCGKRDVLLVFLLSFVLKVLFHKEMLTVFFTWSIYHIIRRHHVINFTPHSSVTIARHTLFVKIWLFHWIGLGFRTGPWVGIRAGGTVSMSISTMVFHWRKSANHDINLGNFIMFKS